VLSMIATIECMTNPAKLEDDDELINIASGYVAPKEVKQDTRQAKAVGEDKCSEYIEWRLKKKEVGVFDTIKCLRLKTFSSSSKNFKAKTEKSAIQGTARDLARVLVVAKFTNVDLKYVLSFPLSPVPHSLANHDGTLAKTDKAALGRLLEQYAEECINDEGSTAWIVDAMAVI